MTSFRAFPYMSVKVSSHYVMRGTAINACTANVAATSPPPALSCDVEFGTGFLPPETDAPRQTYQKGQEDDISAQRPEIGDHHAREIAAKLAFLLADSEA